MVVINEIICWRYVLQGHPEKDFGKFIWSIYCIRVPNTGRMQKIIIILQSIDGNLNKTRRDYKYM